MCFDLCGDAHGSSYPSETYRPRVDVVSRKKFGQNSGLCATMGWECFLFVADAYGAIRSDASAFIGRLLVVGEAPEGPQRPVDGNRTGGVQVIVAAGDMIHS